MGLIGILAYKSIIFQRGNPIPYILGMTKLNSNNTFIDVFKDEATYITKSSDNNALLNFISTKYNVELKDQLGSGYIFTSKQIDLTLSTEVYWKFFRVWDLNINENDTPKINITLLAQTIGATMPELNYASDDKIIFRGYFGLFVYDLRSNKIIRSLDLKEIGCDQTQGSHYSQVFVNKDGTKVVLEIIESGKMYEYNTLNGLLQQKESSEIVDTFHITPNENPKGNVSWETVLFSDGEIGYLEAIGEKVEDLYYIRGSKRYKLFDISPQP